MISAHFQGKPFNITVNQVCAPTSNAEEAEVKLFDEDLQDLLELTPHSSLPPQKKFVGIRLLFCLPLYYNCGSEGKASQCSAGRPGFDPWVRKILWRRKW